MPYCRKCGTKTEEEMVFCPKCGASLKGEPQVTVARRAEKGEKQEKAEEKGEKREKSEKHEKREWGFLGPLVGGIILIFIGFMTYLQIANLVAKENASAFILIVVGLVIMIAAVYGAILASRRHPKT